MSADYGIYYRLYKLDIADTVKDYEEIYKDAAEAWQQDQNWRVPGGLDLLVKGIATYRMGNSHDASSLFYEALKYLNESGSIVYLPHYYLAEAEFHININGNLDHAEVSVSKASRIADSHGMRLFSIDCLLMQTRILLHKKVFSDAKKNLDRISTKRGDLPCDYSLRDTDVILLEAELAVARRNQNARDLLAQAEDRINNTGRYSLRERLDIARNKLP